MNNDFTKQYWEKHYSEQAGKAYQPIPSPHLTEAVSGLSPGKALDAGCGGGADAVWLAGQGWEVTAVDISSAVLSKAKDSAKKSGISVNFEEADLTSWVPEKNYYNLVTSHYVHTTDNRSFTRKLGDSVKPGGTLLLVGHQPITSNKPDPHAHGSHITAEKTASYLNASEWEIEIMEPRTSSKLGSNGKNVVLSDSVFRARKRI